MVAVLSAEVEEVNEDSLLCSADSSLMALQFSTRIRSNYAPFYPTTASRLVSESPARGRDGEGKMRFEPSPLSLSISLQALAARGERKHFGVFQSGSVYCRSFTGRSRCNRFGCGGGGLQKVFN